MSENSADREQILADITQLGQEQEQAELASKTFVVSSFKCTVCRERVQAPGADVAEGLQRHNDTIHPGIWDLRSEDTAQIEWLLQGTPLPNLGGFPRWSRILVVTNRRHYERLFRNDLYNQVKELGGNLVNALMTRESFFQFEPDLTDVEVRSIR